MSELPPPPEGLEEAIERARRLQAAYQASRRAWGSAVGRPYGEDVDPRPPPGELDVEAEE